MYKKVYADVSDVHGSDISSEVSLSQEQRQAISTSAIAVERV
jgi:hypothetical protein